MTWYGISLGGTAHDNEVMYNIIEDAASGGINEAGGVNTVKRNIGWVTENTVVSAGADFSAAAAFDVTIAHGCNYTPALRDCQAWIIENGVVDAAYGYVTHIKSAGAVNVVVVVRVANAVAGATKDIVLRVERQ